MPEKKSFYERMLASNPRRSGNIEDKRYHSMVVQRRGLIMSALKLEAKADNIAKVIEFREINGHKISKRGTKTFERQLETELAKAAAARMKAEALEKKASKFIKKKVDAYRRSPRYSQSLIRPTR